MNAKHLTNPVTFILELDELVWLRNFLKEESLHAEIDHEEVERLHTDVAIQVAKTVLSREHAQMTKIIDAMDEALAADDERKAAARKISETLQAALQAYKEIPASMEDES